MFHDKKWVRPCVDSGKVEQLSRQLGISRLVSSVLISRGITDIEDARKFLNPSLSQLADPFLMPDMEVSVERILLALQRGERICIYGDYDVDGITSVSIIVKMLRHLGADVFYYIPSRLDEGYGLNKQALDEVRGMGAELVITVDCGTVSFDEVEYGNSLGMDLIITDHHQCKEQVPRALGVINPRRKDSSYPFRELAGVGVAYRLCSTLESKLGTGNYTQRLLDLVALGTIADIVPLIGENRVIVREGLKIVNSTSNAGLKALIKVSGLEGKEVNSWHVAFLLAPRINACGRLSNACKGVELFLEEDDEKAYRLAKELDRENRERQTLENAILEEALKQAREKSEKEILVLASKDWHPGVLGIVSSRITESFNKPSIIMCIEEGEARGSARSIPGLDLYDMLSRCRHYYNKFGGHRQAAGLSMDAHNLEAFCREIEDIAVEYMKDIERRPVIEVDWDVSDSTLYLGEVKELNNLEPFGCGNPVPLFLKRNVEVVAANRVGQNKEHLKLTVKSCEQEVDCIVFNWEKKADPLTGERIDLVFTPVINRWMDRENLQFNIKDMKRIENNPAFLSKCYISMNKLIEKERKKGHSRVDPKFFERVRFEKVDNKKEFLYNVFNRCSGNIAVVNLYKTAIECISTLSLTRDVCLRFGRMEGCSNDKNYLLVHPYEFKDLEQFSGNLYLCDPFILPDQAEGIKNLSLAKVTMVLEEGEMFVEEELSELVPGRSAFKEVYTLVRQNPGIGFYKCVYAVKGKGYNPLTVIRVIDIFRQVGLLEVKNSRLIPLPAPQEKVDVCGVPQYCSYKEFVKLAKAGFSTVKNISIDI